MNKKNKKVKGGEKRNKIIHLKLNSFINYKLFGHRLRYLKKRKKEKKNKKRSL